MLFATRYRFPVTRTNLTARFELPVQPGEFYLHRTHPLVEALATGILDSSLDSATIRSRRAAEYPGGAYMLNPRGGILSQPVPADQVMHTYCILLAGPSPRRSMAGTGDAGTPRPG